MVGGHDSRSRMGQTGTERGTFGILNIEIHLLARHGITAMGSDLNDDMLKTISLGEVYSRC